MFSADTLLLCLVIDNSGFIWLLFLFIAVLVTYHKHNLFLNYQLITMNSLVWKYLCILL